MSDFDVAADELLSIIERIESLEAEKKETAELISVPLKKLVIAASARRQLESLWPRRRSDDDIAEEEAILQTYKMLLVWINNIR